ncbi:hypothetical protein LCGC14_0352800 [marine sediment metagenome]
MPRRSLEERLESELARRQKADAKVRALKTRQAKVELQRQKRREALIGQLVLARSAENGRGAKNLRSWLARELDRYLTRDTDRVLMAEFLPPVSAPPAADIAGAATKPTGR